VIAVRRRAFQEGGCFPQGESDQVHHLTEAAREFLTAVQTSGPTVGDPEALVKMVGAVQDWCRTVVQTAPRPAAPGEA
jgi:hypothetical protein